MKKTHLFARRVLLALILSTCLCAQALAALPEYLVPGGKAVGIRLYSAGPVITGLEAHSPAKEAGLRTGDTILQIDSAPVHSAGEIRSHLLDGRSVVIRVLRGKKLAEFLVEPRRSADGYQLGAYIRESICGIGTITFYDPATGRYGALGHGINDFSGMHLLRASGGYLVPARVTDVQKSVRGTPGELHGSFDPTTQIGKVTQNAACGIFGTLACAPAQTSLPVAAAKDVHTGSASILCNVCGECVQEYCVCIEKLYPQADNGRDLLLRVTDPRLLEQTGGIVQGMSGSPILQDGKIVGAVTHVLVNSPEQGYGIFIEHMLDSAG